MDEMAQAEVEAASHNEAATLERKEFGIALATALRAGGKALWIGGSMIGPDRAEGDSPFEFGSDATVGLATVLQIGGELVGGGIALHGEGNRYGAAALARQLVEVEYLAWAFGEDEEEAERWMRSSPQERREMWQPRHLRERADGRFRGVDYGLHCGQGGHPSPEGICLLPEHYSPEASAELWFADMVIHGHSVWRYALAAAEKLEYAETLDSLEEARELAAVEERWREADPFLDLMRRRSRPRSPLAEILLGLHRERQDEAGGSSSG